MTTLKQKMDEWERARKISESRGDDQEKTHPFLKDMDLFHDGLKEAAKILTAQAKHPCDCIEHQNVWYESSPAYGWLKKWGF